ncbi:MAG: hypothetical protein ACREPM_16280 [Gemmatimonadaceae bacterium]
MYSTCIFCHSSLGANEVVEHFPVGRRLAFDAARGRLWAVCRKCERWNLSPIEERWEAIDECERLFAGTRLRVSTGNIGLARAPDALELVRIGSPLRPEMAAWRYGDQFGRRRRRHLLWTGAGFAAIGGIVVLGPVTGIIAGGTWGIWNIASSFNSLYQHRRVRARILLPDRREPARIRLTQLMRAAIVSDEGQWALHLPFDSGESPAVFGIRNRWTSKLNDRELTTVLRGDSALRAAGSLLPAINRSGAKRAEVDDAVRIISTLGEPSKLFERYATQDVPLSKRRTAYGGPGHVLASLPKEIRLALEMATHEDSERRALDGELAVLETAWRDAEEIAAISDDLVVSDETRERLSSLKSGGSRPT